MSVAPSVAEILRDHVTLEVEGIDRMYLNLYVPRLQTDGGVASFLRYERGARVPSTFLLAPIGEGFIKSIESYCLKHQIPLISFKKGERKDDVAAAYRKKFTREEGVLFVGKAQEKARVFRTEKRRCPRTGQTYPWIVPSTAMVNQFYFYAIDRDFGPFFLKFCSYFPFNGKLCINGHEYAKRQLSRRKIPFEALDNGVLSCDSPKRLQRICEELSAEKIDALLRKWLRLLPHPFTVSDRQAGYRYDISILQAEFSLTQVLDRPLQGRVFFEEVIRENLDLGRPSQVQLIFKRKVTRRTPGRFRTRVITEGVTPSLHVDYKGTRIKQYHKEGRALRTETTINNTRDFAIGKRLKNLPALREIGFRANRRLLDVQTISHDCTVGEDAFRHVVGPIDVDGQHASALRFDDPRVQALLGALILFVLQPRGFSNRELREPLARLLGVPPAQLTQGRMTYDLRRLRLHGLISRISGSHRYELTPFGRRIALLFSRGYARLLRPSLAHALPSSFPPLSPLRLAFDALDKEIQRLCDSFKIAA